MKQSNYWLLFEISISNGFSYRTVQTCLGFDDIPSLRQHLEENTYEEYIITDTLFSRYSSVQEEYHNQHFKQVFEREL